MTTAIATREPITRSEMLSEQERVRHNLARLVNQITNNGATLVQFLHDTVQGEYPDAKHHHRQIAAIELSAMGGHRPEDMPGAAARVIREEDMPKPQKPKATLKQIINKPIGAYIREETHDCRALILKLNEILDPPHVFESANPAERKYQKAARIRPHHQIAAAKEMIKRGIGGRSPYCQPQTSPVEEKMLNSRLSREIREIADDGIGLARFLLEVVDNPKTYGPRRTIIEDPYTQTHRIWAIRDLIYRAVDIPWEHITPESIDACFRELDAKERQETERRLAERRAAADLTPEQKAEILALFEQTQRENEQRQAKYAAKAEKQAKKSHADKADAQDCNSAANPNNADAANSVDTADANGNNAALDANNGNNAGNAETTGKDNANAKSASANGKNADANNKNGENGKSSANVNNAATAAKDTGSGNNVANGNNADADSAAKDTGAHTTTPPTDRGATAVANALARHPQVDLDTVLENHHSTAGIPKEDLTHEQIYDAITAEANFQKRQAIIQRRLHPENPDAAHEDNDPPKSRSP